MPESAYTLHPSPYSLYPTPYTPHPTRNKDVHPYLERLNLSDLRSLVPLHHSHSRLHLFSETIFTDMCSGSEAGSYLRLVDFLYHTTLGWRVIKKKKRAPVRRDNLQMLIHMKTRGGKLCNRERPQPKSTLQIIKKARIQRAPFFFRVYGVVLRVSGFGFRVSGSGQGRTSPMAHFAV